MIIGGVGGVMRVGGALAGLKLNHLPVSVDFGRSNIDGVFVENRPISYSATVKINDGVQDIPIGEVINFQISANINGSGNAMLTVRDTDKWGISQTTYQDLLRPSNKILTITISMMIGTSSYDVDVFTGTIESYSESQGASGGSISLSCRPASVSILNKSYNAPNRLTAFRAINDALKSTGSFSKTQGLVMMLSDKPYGGAQETSIGELINSITLGTAIVEERTAGGLKIDNQSGEEVETPAVFTVSDDNTGSITRSVGAQSTFNTITAWGLDDDGELVTQVVQDAADVAARGVLRYSTTYGDPELSIESNVAAAEALLSVGLRGRVSVQMVLNPFLQVGDLISFSSVRLGITSATAKVNRLQHHFAHGNAQTWLSEVSLL
jgi:hypothetical protein